MDNEFRRKIVYYENHYLIFFETLKPEVKKKFNWTLQLISTVDRVPEKYLNTCQILLEFMKYGLSTAQTLTGFSVFSIRGI